MTGEERVNIYEKKFLGQQEITTNFLDYLNKLIQDNLYWVVRTQGVFDPDPTVTDLLSSSVIDSIDFVTPLVGTDDTFGHILSLDPTEASAVPFENTAAIDYHTGLRHIEIPKTSELNVKTGKVKFTLLEERIGVRADPDSVVDDGDSTMTIIVDSVTEAGVSNAGRKVRVWLNDPESEAELFEELTVIWDGSNNKIETVTPLGQSTISTDSTKYQVVLLGPEIKRNTDLTLDPNVTYTGKVTGIGLGSSPTVFDFSDVVNLSAGFGTLSSLFYAEHDPVDGTHTDITPETIVTDKPTGGVQFDLQANAADEDVPDAAIVHTLFPSVGGTGIQNVKFRIRNDAGTTVAFLDAHGNLYCQSLAAVVSLFKSNITIEGNQTVLGSVILGDSPLVDSVTFTSMLKSLTDFNMILDSDNDDTGNFFNWYKHAISGPNLLMSLSDLGDLLIDRDVLTGAKTVYSSAAGAVIPTNASLNEIQDETLSRKLLKPTSNSPSDEEINIAGARKTLADGSDFVAALEVMLFNSLVSPTMSFRY